MDYYLTNKTYQDGVSKLNTKADKLAVNSMLSLPDTLILFPLLLDVSLSLISHLQGQREKKKKSFYLILAASDSQLKEIIKTKTHTTHQRGYF